MKISLNELLLHVPYYQLNFLTPFPKEEINYEQVEMTISEQWFEKKTVLLLEREEEIQKLNDKNIVNRLIQDSYLFAIVVCKKSHFSIQRDVLLLYKEMQIPVIQIEDTNLSAYFLQTTAVPSSYSQFSQELNGFINKGFMNMAANLSLAFATPLLFLDENQQLLWQTGHDDEVKKALRWLTIRQESERELQLHRHEDRINITTTVTQEKKFKQHKMNIAGQTNIYVIASADLVEWQEKFIDKFIGLTAVVFQTDELVRVQNDRFKEFFLYELLYRKFESKKVLIKQGKTWGWDLGKAHHLIILQIGPIEEAHLALDWIDEILLLLETNNGQGNPPNIVVPFQDQIVIFVEDDEVRMQAERKQFIVDVAKGIVSKITSFFPLWSIQIGIGKWYSDTIYLNKSYQEAKMAMEFGKKWFENQQVFHINDIGVPHLLTHVHQEILYDFCKEYLAQIIESDEKKDTEYLKTLKMYLQHQGVITDVSKALFIHQNTLRYRIKKIEEITGVDLQNIDELLNLMVAVKVYFSFFYKEYEKN